MSFSFPEPLSRYSRVFVAAYIFASLYALVILVASFVYLLGGGPVTNNEYAQIVADRLLSGRFYVIPFLTVIFQLSFWKQRYFAEVLTATTAWIAATYIDDYFSLGSRFLASHLWQTNLLLAPRPVLLIALVWMVFEQRQKK